LSGLANREGLWLDSLTMASARFITLVGIFSAGKRRSYVAQAFQRASFPTLLSTFYAISYWTRMSTSLFAQQLSTLQRHPLLMPSLLCSASIPYPVHKPQNTAARATIPILSALLAAAQIGYCTYELLSAPTQQQMPIAETNRH
jgi:hypothetical protein